MSTFSFRRPVVILSLLGGIVFGLFIAEGRTCAWTEGPSGSALINRLSADSKRSYIDYVLSPGEGILKKRCDKRNVLIFIGNELWRGRPVDFDKEALLTYLLDKRENEEGGWAVSHRMSSTP